MKATMLGWSSASPALCRKGVSALLPALSALLLGACQVATDPYGRTVVSTPTLGQVLGVAPRPGAYSRVPYVIPAAAGAARDRRVVAGRTVEVVASGTAHQIVVDGRVLATDAEDDRVVIQGVHQGGGRTYVLVEEQSGGNACPSMYQAIDLSGAAPAISPQFGNCSDVPKVSVGNGALRVSVPAFRAAPTASYAFRDGRLTRMGPASK